MACCPFDGAAHDLFVVRELLKGSPKRWDAFLAQTRAIAVATVRKTLFRYGVTPSTQDVEDILHELWLSLLRDDKRKLRGFEPERGLNLVGWISLLARHTAIDWLRERKPQHVPIEDLTGWALESEQIGPEGELDLDYQAKLAREALGVLSAAERAFLRDCLEDDLTPREIATQHRMTVGAVYTRKCRVIGKLAKAVQRLET